MPMRFSEKFCKQKSAVNYANTWYNIKGLGTVFPLRTLEVDMLLKHLTRHCSLCCD